MAVPFLIIDGYNLLHAAGLARRSYGPRDLEVCRKRLLLQLAGRLAPAIVERTTVVFDAFSREDNSQRHQVCHALQVVFAPAGTDADTEIERRIARHDAPRQLLIVSSDHRLQRAAKRRRCQVVDSEDFWAELEEETGGQPVPDGGISDNPGTAFWLQEFGDAVDPRDSSLSADNQPFDDDYLTDLESELDD